MTEDGPVATSEESAIKVGRLNRNYLLILACVDCSTPFWIYWDTRSADVSKLGVILITALPLLFFNGLALFNWRAQVRRSRPPFAGKWIAVTVILTVISFAVSLSVSSSTPSSEDYLRLAASGRPLDTIQPMRTRIFIGFLRETAANSRENDKEIACAREHPINPTVYSAASFADAGAMQNTVDRLQQVVAASNAYYAKQQQTSEQFRRQMATVDPGFLKGFVASRRPWWNAEETVEQAQQQWVASIDSLYAFARAHSSEMMIDNGTIHFTSQADTAEFKTRMKLSQEQQQRFLAAIQKTAALKQQESKGL